MPRSFMQSWRDKHPNWDYMLWDEHLLNSWFKGGLQNQRQYNEMPELCGKCDIARYEILHKFGGFYADADSICLESLDDYLLINQFFASYENEFVRGGLVSNAFMGSVPGLTFTQSIMDAIGGKSGKALWDGHPSAWRTVGPVLLTSVLHQTRFTNASIYPSYFFTPHHYTGVEYLGPAKSYARQYWGSTPNSGYDYPDRYPK